MSKSIAPIILSSALLAFSSTANATTFDVTTLLTGTNGTVTSRFGSSPPASHNGSTVISTLDGSQIVSGMTVNYSAKAQVSAGGVIKFGASLINTNPALISGGSIQLQAFANYSDSFNITGDSTLNHISIGFNIDGILSNVSGAGSANLRIEDGNGGVLFSANEGFRENIINDLFFINNIAVVNGVADVSFLSRASVTAFLDFVPFNNVDFTASADFLNTLTIAEFNGFDASGNSVELFNVADSSGVEFVNVSNVPVPTAAWLFGSGLLGLVGVARRKKA